MLGTSPLESFLNTWKVYGQWEGTLLLNTLLLLEQITNKTDSHNGGIIRDVA